MLHNNVLFVAATRANAVWRLPIAPDGTVVRMGARTQLSGGRGPDGLAIDEAGGLLVAHPDMGAVWVFEHRGEPKLRVQSCASDVVTNVCFGGEDRRTICITDSGAGAIPDGASSHRGSKAVFTLMKTSNRIA